MNYKSSPLPGQNEFDLQLTLNQFRLHNQDLNLQINKQVIKCDDPRLSVPFSQYQGAFLDDLVQFSRTRICSTCGVGGNSHTNLVGKKRNAVMEEIRWENSNREAGHQSPKPAQFFQKLKQISGLRRLLKIITQILKCMDLISCLITFPYL